MKSRLKKMIIGTPAEPMARWLRRRLRSSSESALLPEDLWTFAILRRILRPDSNCVDVGCAQGHVLREIVRLSPRGRHHAFEPIPGAAGALRSAFPDVEIHETALSDVPGESTFQHVVSNPGYSGLRPRQYPTANEKIETLRVRVARLDDEIDPGHRVDFIKIDVEGAELQVLRGAEKILRTWTPYVIFEHGMGAAEFYGTTPELVYDFVTRSCGLEISLLPDWLEGTPSLDRRGFVGMFGGQHWYFVAHPHESRNPHPQPRVG